MSTSKTRRLDHLAGHFPAGPTDLAAALAALTPQERAAWDAIVGRFDDRAWPFPLHPDDAEAMTELLSHVAERLGVEVDPVWRSGWPIRYRSDWRRRDDPALVGRLAGFEVLNPDAVRRDDARPRRSEAPRNRPYTREETP